MTHTSATQQGPNRQGHRSPETTGERGQCGLSRSIYERYEEQGAPLLAAFARSGPTHDYNFHGARGKDLFFELDPTFAKSRQTWGTPRLKLNTRVEN